MAPNARKCPPMERERCKRRKAESTRNAAAASPSQDFAYNYTNCGLIPSTDDNPGIYNFSILLNQIASTKNKWTYCAELNKLYIVWHQVIPLEFNWTRYENEKLVVRALPIFNDPQYLHEPVERCFIHLDPTDPSNEGISYVRHVLRSENPGAIYCENPDSHRSSVVVPLEDPQPGTGSVTITYKFMCKTSCVTGKTRRNMAVIFTLERITGEVVGRQTMGVKVCSCPRRDMEKEELIMRRKIKMEPRQEDKSPYSLDIDLPDLEMFKKILEFNHGGVSSLLRTTPSNDPKYVELNDFLTVLEEKLSYLSQ